MQHSCEFKAQARAPDPLYVKFLAPCLRKGQNYKSSQSSENRNSDKGVAVTLDSRHVSNKRQRDGRYSSSHIVAETLGGASSPGREYLEE